ncbi:MAG: valine--tRNA ligase, partial [Candidatus Brocadiia bacterium]
MDTETETNDMFDIEIGTTYEPTRIEDPIYSFWEEGKFFHPDPEDPGESFTVVIPPPNVTGELHMGHALNNTLQDIFVRRRRMQGYNTLWVPGTDHAGIATQNVVEQQLAGEGLHRWDVGRENFIERVWEWREEYGDRITKQLRRMGSSLDWDRERFTMDEGLSDAVLETFIQLYERGLIYRGKYIINWCPRCGTALADDEVEHDEHDGHLWYIQYAFKDKPSQYITVATTRPETMLGDTAVAVNPDDERYKHLVGRTLVLPIVGREIPIVADDWVDPEFGTGAVKVTPAHDPDDFELGQRHDLEVIQVIDGEGKMTIRAGERYEGMDRLECREALVEDLHDREDLESTEAYVHSVGHCYRCNTVIEPYLSDQWFVKMRPLAEMAIEATRQSEVEFHPERWEDYYLGWLENVRDWCISRQIWWGHRLPVYYCQNCENPVVAREHPDCCPECGHEELRQDEDVLDTWFSSALWPFSTLGWPQKTEDLDRYYPTDVLVTDRGIIYFWVARMVMMGLELMDEVPFSDVLIHGTILDERGRKMSKSLGNGIDPIEMAEQYGADAVRFSLIMLTTEGQDIKLSESKFEMGRNFANKVWNASRFVLMNLEDTGDDDVELSPDQLAANRTFEDRWILSRLAYALNEVDDYLDELRTNESAQRIYDFFWHEFCDWYLEEAKLRLRESDDPVARACARETLAEVLDTSLRMMHPFVPYLTEALWHQLRDVAEAGAPLTAESMNAEALIVADWPEL